MYYLSANFYFRKMIKLYGGRMGSALRNHWMLEELGVEYEQVPLNMREREHKKPEFLALNPTGQVPVLVDGDFVLSESMAINEYLGLKYGDGKLLGETPAQKAEAWKWSLWAYINMQPHFEEGLYQAFGIRPENKDALAKSREAIQPYLEILEKHLEGKEYILGDKFSVADINASITLSYGKYVEIDLSKFPNITAWLNRLLARPTYLKATNNN